MSAWFRSKFLQLGKLMKMGKLSDREKTVLPIAIVMLVLAAVIRTQPHLSNSTPFFAITVLVGFMLGPKRAVLAGVMSAVAMFGADLVIGMHWTMIFVYAGMAMAALIGATSSSFIMTRRSWLARGASAFVVSGLASTVFFVISNFGVWLVGIDTGLAMYPMTFAGLVDCFKMALPFFTRSLGADLLYGTIFVLLAARMMVPHTQAVSKTDALAVAKTDGR